MTTSEQINEIAAACAKAQLELQPAIKDAVNPAFRSKYADYASIQEASRVYAKHGVAVFQEPVTTDSGVAVTTLLAHTSGQWIRLDPFTVPMAKKDAHGVGSATTYAKRYAKSAALGIAADEDDDGNAAAAQPAKEPTKAAEPPKYRDWRDDLAATADDGIDALQQAWTKSDPALRRYLTAHDNTWWESLKTKASKTRAKVPE